MDQVEDKVTKSDNLNSAYEKTVGGGWAINGWQGSIDMRKQIFCNRSLNMKSIVAVGFDMDYTLAQYKAETFETMAYHGTIKKLVFDLGYPKEVCTPLSLSFKKIYCCVRIYAAWSLFSFHSILLISEKFRLNLSLHFFLSIHTCVGHVLMCPHDVCHMNIHFKGSDLDIVAHEWMEP